MFSPLRRRNAVKRRGRRLSAPPKPLFERLEDPTFLPSLFQSTASSFATTMVAFFRRTKSALKTTRQRAASWKPQLEVLECRLVPSTFTPISLGSAATRQLSTVDPTFPTG